MADVQGYEFQSVEGHERNGTICKIKARAQASESDVIDMGPAFRVEFGDGTVMTAYSSELHPWYPV